MRQAIHQQGFSEDILVFKTKDWIAWAGAGANLFFILFQGWTAFVPWNVEAFFQNYVIVVVFIVLYGGWKVYHKTPWVNPKMADLVSNRRDLAFAEPLPDLNEVE